MKRMARYCQIFIFINIYILYSFIVFLFHYSFLNGNAHATKALWVCARVCVCLISTSRVHLKRGGEKKKIYTGKSFHMHFVRTGLIGLSFFLFVFFFLICFVCVCVCCIFFFDHPAEKWKKVEYPRWVYSCCCCCLPCQERGDDVLEACFCAKAWNLHRNTEGFEARDASRRRCRAAVLYPNPSPS